MTQDLDIGRSVPRAELDQTRYPAAPGGERTAGRKPVRAATHQSSLMLLTLFVTCAVATVGWLWYGTITGKYGFQEFYQDGKAMIYGMKRCVTVVVVSMPN